MPLLLLSIVAATAPINLGPAWATISRRPALERVKTNVEIGTLGVDRERGQLDFWLRRTVTKSGKDDISWADSRTCAAVRPAIARMRDLPVPKFAPPGFSEGPPLVLDGVAYSLRTYSDEGELTAVTNVETPLAQWVEESFKALNSCWTSTVPKRTP